MTHELFELSWPEVQSAYTRLLNQPLDQWVFEDWLREWSALECRIDSLGAELMRATYRDTTDPMALHKFQSFIREMAGPSEQERAKLRRKALLADKIVPGQYKWLLEVFAHSERLAPDTTHKIAEEIELRADHYLKLKNQLRGKVGGTELSVVELRPPKRSKNRDLREDAWRAERAAYRQRSKEIGAQYVALAGLRKQMARQAGYSNFLAYQWDELRRYAFTLQDCTQFASRIASTFQPLLTLLSHKRGELLGISVLRPWDEIAELNMDGELRPYSSTAEFLDKTQSLIGELDQELGQVFSKLRDAGNLDIEDLPNKADRTFTNTYHDRGTAYVFMRAIGTPLTVDMLIHECAHAMHFTLMKPRLFWYREGVPIEFLEAISQLMELLTLDGLGKYYSEEQLKAVRFDKLEGIIKRMLGDLITETFQQWVYQQDPAALSLESLNQAYADISSPYQLDMDWSDLENERGTGWQSDHLMFVHPLKSIEYTYAWIAALNVYRQFKGDREQTLARVKAAMRLGNSVPLADLYQTLGHEFPTSEAQISAVGNFLVTEFADVLQ